MADITIYIANLAGVDDDTMTNVSNLLSGYWNSVLWSTDYNLTGVKVVKHNSGISVRKTDLLCYIVPNFTKSKVKLWSTKSTYNGTDGGLTAYTDSEPWKSASEVYADVVNATASDVAGAYANLIFHELMHNKGTIGDELHNIGGYGLASETVDATSALSDGNCTFLRGILDKEVTQYVASF
ncbi:MAG: hypothetical protein JWO03_3740 [Bacteroidetes bacterium]|nr:hypothetical protein [Bacteroidota bacterium]